ncbi:MAG: hypothetical protein A2252_12370 [Elusimicrobia bacterium RIFOXYA2_FULL_39_19]|nr:MAG: hypothetical protein A2252_12370 [Elusimicrobia bacterium RIFOXYA2_FULL_39_19]
MKKKTKNKLLVFACTLFLFQSLSFSQQSDYSAASKTLFDIKVSQYTNDEKELKKQAAALEALIVKYPGFPELNQVYLVLGMKYKALKEWKKGIYAYQKALELNPGLNKNYIKQNVKFLQTNYVQSQRFLMARIYLGFALVLALAGMFWKEINLRYILKTFLLSTVLFAVWVITLLVTVLILKKYPPSTSKITFVFLWIEPFKEAVLWNFLPYAFASLFLTLISVSGLRRLIKFKPAFYFSGFINSVLVAASVFYIFFIYQCVNKSNYQNGYFLFKAEIENVYPKHPDLFPKDFNPFTSPPEVTQD